MKAFLHFLACFGVWTLGSMPCYAGTLAGGEAGTVAWWRVILSLSICLGLAALAPHVLKWRAKSANGSGLAGGWPVGAGGRYWRPKRSAAASPRLERLETVRLGPAVELHLLRWDVDEVLLAVTAQGAVVVAERRRLAEANA